MAMMCLARHFVRMYDNDAAVAYDLPREVTAACPPTGVVRSGKPTVAAYVYTLPFLHFKRRIRNNYNLFNYYITYTVYRLPRLIIFYSILSALTYQTT